MEAAVKPLVLVCSTPGYGHVMPVRSIAKNLVGRGYEVIYLTGGAYRSKIEEIGAIFRPLLGIADWSEANVNDLFPDQDKNAPPSGPYRLPYSFKYLFANTIPYQYESVQKVLEEIQTSTPKRKVVIVQDFLFWGTFPVSLGAPGIKPAGIISFGIAPLPLSAPNVPPFGLGLLHDSSPEGLARNKEMYKFRDEELFGSLTGHIGTIFKDLGAEPSHEIILDMCVKVPDRFMQTCIPSLEYPRENPPPGLRVTGGLPQGHRDAAKKKPEWWDDFAINTAKKRIIAVSQGTATSAYEKLIVPALQGLMYLENVLVVAALGREGAVLPEGTVIPANARVGDFIPFDELLPYTDVFVMNGGYGGFQHAVAHEVPLIVAGIAADKPEVAVRAAWAGLGINMMTETPRPNAVRDAVEQVLTNSKYKVRARELGQEAKQYDIFTIVVQNIAARAV